MFKRLFAASRAAKLGTGGINLHLTLFPQVQLAKYHYHATVLSYGLWGSATRLQFKCEVPAYFKTVFKHFNCRPSELRNFALGYFNFTLTNDDVLGALDCSWRDFENPKKEPPGMKLPSEKCLERFPGRLVYRSAMARFEWSHACVGNHTNPRNMVSRVLAGIH
jgi:hypothetical protein